ncbi:MAG: pyocin knob domain-containing protein, partial [Capnocytophaga felis]|nr:pyocin knob domain-containing protein [Capnocytophaga felis]
VNNPFDFKGSTELGNVNLDTVTQPGVYRQDRGAYANKANNYPTDNIRGGSLYVLPVSSPDASNIFHQLFISGGTTNTGTNTAYYYEVPRVFLRKYVRGGKWVGWFELSSTKRILSQSANTFTTDDFIEELSQHEATILLPDSEVTITINKGKRTQITYVQTSEKSVTLAPQDDLTIVGKTSFEGKIGREIKIILAENTAYVSGGDTELPKAPEDDKEYVLHNKKWKAFAGFQFRELSDGENLNNIKQAGLYGQYNSQAATVARNFPYDAIRGGHLMVLPMTLRSNLLTVFQVYWSAGTSNQGDYTNNARIFMRAFVNNSQWLPWIEFNGGKVHQFTGATQNLATAFNNAFPNNESTFVLKQATTVTINRSRQIIRYVKDTDADITFTGASGVNVVGGGVVNAPKGTLITVVCYDNNAYVCYDRDSKEDSYVISVTSNLVLDKPHVGRTLQFNNNSNITIDISNFPTGAMLSGVKNSGNGTVTFTGATAPSVGNVIGNTTNSSFALTKNDSGVSNLIISNR